MSYVKKVYRRSDHGSQNEFMEHNFEKRECNRFRPKTTKNHAEICKCGYSKAVHSNEALENEHDESKPLTKTFPTDAFGKLAIGNTRAQSSYGKYVRLDSQTDVKKISKCLFDIWKLDRPEVIFSILSDGDVKFDIPGCRDAANAICESLVKAAASTNAWIITDVLYNGVGQLIGAAMTLTQQIPDVVLGFCHWGCLEEKKNLLTVQDATGAIPYASDSILNGVSLNIVHNSHFLLVDDGTQRKSGCEGELRRRVELSLMKNLEDTFHAKDKKVKKSKITTQEHLGLHQLNMQEQTTGGRPLIYFLIGGGIRELGLAKSALSIGIAVIVVKGTGGAADIILDAESNYGALTMNTLPEIAEKLFDRLLQLLMAGSRVQSNDFSSQVGFAIRTIMIAIKLELFFNIMELLDKVSLSEEDVQQLKDYDFADSVTMQINVTLAGIKDFLICKQTASDSSNKSSAKTDIVNRMRDVFYHMLDAFKIPRKDARQAVDALEPNLLENMLAKVRNVFEYLDAIRDKSDLLRIFDTEHKDKRTLTHVIVEVLKQAKAGDVYPIAADLDQESFFKDLLLENWMANVHEDIFLKLSSKGKTKYVQLIAEHFINCNWLPKHPGPLQEAFTRTEFCAKLLKKITDPESSTDSEDKRRSMKAKMLFIWCILKETSQSEMFLWEQGQDYLAMALVAHAECSRQMIKLLHEEGYVKMKKHTEFFEELAINFLRLCYADNPQNTHDLLVGKVEDLDDLTPLQIAVDANFKSFILIEPVQSLLRNVWNKDIQHYNKLIYIPRIVSLAFPLLAPALFEIRLPADDSKDENQKNKTAHCCKSVSNYFRKVVSFVNTPVVKFSYNFIFHIIYLTLFSVVMLTDFRTKMSPSEIALTIWTFILLIEEVNQAVVGKVKYWKDKWNYFDIGALTLYIIGFILRVIYLGDPTICPDCLYVARIILTFSLMIFFFRALEFLSAHDTLGPKIYMIEKLFSDLVAFMLILAVFVSSYGVGSNAIMYPNQPLNAKLLKDVFYDAWWSVLQQLTLEDALGLNCNKDNDSAIITAEYCSCTSGDNIDYVQCKENQCPANNWIVSVLLVFYTLLTCIMLLNVLIAMFNDTFTRITENQIRVSKVQRFVIIREYSSRSVLPPPLCVIAYPYYLILQLRCLFKKDKSEGLPEAFAKTLAPKVKDWEQDMLDKFYELYEIAELEDSESEQQANFCVKLTGGSNFRKMENQKEIEKLNQQRRGIPDSTMALRSQTMTYREDVIPNEEISNEEE